jgi:hypothetical protein
MKKLFYTILGLGLGLGLTVGAATVVSIGKNGTSEYLLYPTDSLSAHQFIGTSTTAVNTFPTALFTNATTTTFAVTGLGTSTFAGSILLQNNGHLTAHGILADGSDGLHMNAGNGTEVVNLGAGNTANSLFYGAVNINGATRLATSLNGLAFLTNGAVSGIATSTLNLTTSSFASPNISQWTNNSGYITSASLPTGSNPTASVGVTAVNGVATTFMRSDASPALDSGLYSTFNGKVSSSSLSATFPLAYNSATGAFTFNGLGTTTAWTTGQLAYVVNGNTLTSVATGTLSGTNGVTVTAGRSVVGGSATVDCTVASSASAGCLSSANWTTFNNKVATGSAIVTGQLPYWLSGGTLGSVATGTVSASLPLSVTAGRSVIGGALAISIADAVADASTKGASTYTANDFNSSSGNISLDYTNGQSASASNKGFLTSADWSVFNNKVGSTSLSGASVISYTGATGVITTLGGTFGAGNYTFPAGLNFVNATGTSVYASASSTFQVLNVGSLTMPSKSDGCATFASGVLNSTGSACGSGGGGGYSLFSTSTVYTSSIFMNAGDSLGLGTSTNRSALSMLALATTTGNHLTLRNGNYTWFQKVNDTGSYFFGTTSSTYATATHSALIVPATGGLIVGGSGSSTLLNGITIQNGCYSVNGTCIGSGGTLTGAGSANKFAYWTSANNLSYDASVSWDSTLAQVSGTGLSFTRSTTTNATSTDLFSTRGLISTFIGTVANFITTLVVPNGTAPTVDRVGGIAFDTTDNQFLVGTSTESGASAVGVLPTVQKIWGATVASTSLEMVSGGRLWLPPQRDGFTVKEIHCAVDAGTSVVINLSNSGGTTDSDTVTCDADGAVDTAMSTNYTYAAGSLNSLEIGTVTGSVDYLTFSIWGTYTRE